MTKRISIVKGGTITNMVELPELEANEWLAKHISMGTFGKAAYSYEQEVEPAVFDGEGNILTPAVMETINVPAEYEVVEEDITIEVASKASLMQKIADGRAAREACQHVLDLIAGYNLERDLTPEQITSMQSSFSQIELALRSARPSSAKALITAMEPDGTLVTAEMKAICLELLVNY